MKITFQNKSVSGDFDSSDDLAGFFIWLANNRQNEDVNSILILIAEHDSETNSDERLNIRRTIAEIMTEGKAQQ